MQPVAPGQEQPLSVRARAKAAIAAPAGPIPGLPVITPDLLALSAAVRRAPLPPLPIRYGAKDDDYGRKDPGPEARGPVRRLQTALADLGHFRSTHGATGGYFKDTAAAVKTFQRAEGLAATGLVDEATWRALEARLVTPAAPTPPEAPVAPRPQTAPSRLEAMTPAELVALGRTDKKAFFEALRPAAEEAERRHGVPAAVTLAQAALESGWAKHAIGGYNIFGIKGRGPAGTVAKVTHEKNRTQRIVARFAKYDNFHQAVAEHGKLFHNGYYTRAMTQYAKDGDAEAFARNISNVYTQDGAAYGRQLIQIMNKYELDRPAR